MRTRTGMWVRIGHGLAGPCYGFVLLTALGVAACGSTERNPGKPMPGSAGSANVAGGDGGGGVAGGGETDDLLPLPSEIHRLNGAEYRATVSDLLGAHAPDSLPPDGEINGFDNIAEAQSVSEDGYALYLAAAEQVAAEVFASDVSKARVVFCSTPDDAACVRDVISSVGLRLFRRPLLDAEIAAYEKVYAAARTREELHEGALQQVLVALLASAQFIYRMEFPVGAPGTQALGPYEVASRLSYLLWSSAPDDALLNAAQADTLAQDDELTAQVARMWDDPKSQRFVTNFAGQWLGARRLPFHPVSTDVYPEWTPDVAPAAAQEMYAYFDDFLRRDRDFGGFYTSRTHFVNESLGKLYGIEVSGPDLQHAVLEQGERQGYVGLIGFLTLTSMSGRTSIPGRGNFILRQLLCMSLPPVPSTVPALEDENAMPTPREYFEGIEKKPECGSCHKVLDPFGFALDRYDGIGRPRTTYPDLRPIDQVAHAAPSTLFPQGAIVDGLPGVAQALAADPRSKSCLVENIYTYGLGHVPRDIDENNVPRFAKRWEGKPLLIKDLVRQLVLSTPFRFRSDGGLP